MTHWLRALAALMLSAAFSIGHAAAGNVSKLLRNGSLASFHWK